MNCQNRMVHTIQEGDSLYRLARQYHTTVTDLILGNPGVNPYNLQIGMRLFVCPGEGYEIPGQNVDGMNSGESNANNRMPGMNRGGQMPGMSGMPGMNQGGQVPGMPGMNQGGQMPGMPGMNQGGQMPGMSGMPGMNRGGQMPGMNRDGEETQNEMENSVQNMTETMRLAWLSLIYWTRMYLMSVDADAKDQQAVEERLIEAADEITDVFARTLPIQAVRQMRNLFMEHVELTGEIIRTLKSGEMENYDELIKQWYANANQLAELLANQNPYFGNRETRNVLLNYLDMTREAIEHQINGEYGQSIDTFRDIKDLVLKFADYLARGLLAR